MHALLLGVVAGLAVAVPLGPVGALLLRTGLTQPRRVAFAAAAGVATVDLAYAVVAVLVGARVAEAIGAHATGLRRVAGLVLLVVGLVELVRSVRRVRDGAAAVSGGPGDEPAVPPVRPTGSARRAYAQFVALTAVNPLTALTFATVAAGLAGRLATGGHVRALAVVAFPLGVGVASLAWQCVLAGAGGVVGARLGPRARAGTDVAAALLVVVLAVLVAVS